MLANTGPSTKRNTPLAAVLVLLDDFGAGDIGGHEVGRELDAVERDVDGAGDGLDHERFGKPRHADHQRMTACEDRHEQVIDDFLLADDDLADFIA